MMWTAAGRWLVLASALTLAGCGLAQQAKIQEEIAVAKKTRDAQIAECKRRYPDHHRKPVTPRIKCFNEADLNYNAAYDQSVGNPQLDLVRSFTAQRLVIGERYDNGHLSQAQYDAEMASAEADSNSPILQRQNEADMIAAAQSQAAAAYASSAAASSAAAAASRPRTCTRIGYSVICN
jgi:hypothetical protein